MQKGAACAGRLLRAGGPFHKSLGTPESSDLRSFISGTAPPPHRHADENELDKEETVARVVKLLARRAMQEVEAQMLPTRDDSLGSRKAGVLDVMLKNVSRRISLDMAGKRKSLDHQASNLSRPIAVIEGAQENERTARQTASRQPPPVCVTACPRPSCPHHRIHHPSHSFLFSKISLFTERNGEYQKFVLPVSVENQLGADEEQKLAVEDVAGILRPAMAEMLGPNADVESAAAKLARQLLEVCGEEEWLTKDGKEVERLDPLGAPLIAKKASHLNHAAIKAAVASSNRRGAEGVLNCTAPLDARPRRTVRCLFLRRAR